ncbi:MAG: ABC transporter permease subunit [Gammaproteobacteria bacterium]
MPFTQTRTYTKDEAIAWPYPNYWDFLALCLVLGTIILLIWISRQMATPYHLGQPLAISLDPAHLPYYALRSVLRMLFALVCSLLFTFTISTWAAKSRRAERIIIPMIDILQSVPILGFLPVVLVFFIRLFPNSLLGPECAAIFVIFTSQAWNMALSFYQSLRTVPSELHEASAVFRLSAWQQFWRIEVPFAMPGLLWNTMMSMSASWFFVVASESFSVANQNINLPGIGSYVALALIKADKWAIFYAIITMLVVILLYDQLLFRPLVYWVEKFKAEQTGGDEMPNSWMVNLFQRTRLLRQFAKRLNRTLDSVIDFRLLNRKPAYRPEALVPAWHNWLGIAGVGLFLLSLLAAIVMLLHALFTATTLNQVLHVIVLGLITGLRVMLLVALSSLIWVPVGVWVGLRPKVTEYVQPLVQFLAAFPANLLFPLIVIAIVAYHLNVEIWTSPLMIMGTQWYILFNVIAGTAALPKDLKQVTENFNWHGWLWWRRFILPGIFPYYLTGAITAAGGAWNASIVAEVITWGNTTLHATGLGAYIVNASSQGDFSALALGIAVMSIFIIIINRLFWRPLYRFAAERFQLGQ